MGLKQTVLGLLREGRLEQIADIAEQKRRVLGSLVSSTFDPDPLICWRAIEAMGLVCDRVSERDPGCVRQFVRRLYWLITEESGGICWHAPEAMAEVVSRRPGPLSDFIAITVHLLQELAEEDLEHFRAGALWAIGRLCDVCQGHVDGLLPDIAAGLDQADPQVRGMAVWCLTALDRPGPVRELPGLLEDEGAVVLYEGRELTRLTVGDLARHAAG